MPGRLRETPSLRRVSFNTRLGTTGAGLLTDPSRINGSFRRIFFHFKAPLRWHRYGTKKGVVF